MLSKLRHYGVTGIELDFFTSYLLGRVQYVEYSGVCSQELPISIGVPQGSVLGPLLFLIYINDLPTVSNIFNILMYADDTTLFCNFDNTQNEFTINNELDNVQSCQLSRFFSRSHDRETDLTIFIWIRTGPLR